MISGLSRRLLGIASAVVLGVWSLTTLALNVLGLMMLPDDWRQVMHDQLPAVLGWLFSTPWQVPGLMAVALTAWVMWITRPAFPAISQATDRVGLPEPAAEKLRPTQIAAMSGEAEAERHPHFDPKGLYVGIMQVDTQHLEERRIVEVVAICFNATGHTINVQRAAGVIHASEFSGDIMTPLGNLPPPWIIEGRTTTEGIQNFSEFMFVLEQRVPSEIADRFKHIGEGYDVRLDLGALDVMVVSQEDPKKTVRVPVWPNMRIDRDKSRLHYDRGSTGTSVILLAPVPRVSS